MSISIWSKLPDNVQYDILGCKKLKDIHKVLNNFHASNWDYDKEELENALHLRYKQLLAHNSITNSFLGVITDHPSYAPMTLLSILDAVSLPLLSLGLLTGIFAAALLASITAYFILAYRKYRRTQTRNEKYFDFLQIKQGCADALIKRHHLQFPKHLKEFGYKPKQEVRDQALGFAISFGGLTYSMLIGTYFLCVTGILTAFGIAGAVAAMTGPIGLPITVAIAIGIGIYIGYRQYQAYMQTKKHEAYKEHLFKNVYKKIDLCVDNLPENDYKPELQKNIDKSRKRIIRKNNMNTTSFSNAPFRLMAGRKSMPVTAQPASQPNMSIQHDEGANSRHKY